MTRSFVAAYFSLFLRASRDEPVAIRTFQGWYVRFYIVKLKLYCIMMIYYYNNAKL